MSSKFFLKKSDFILKFLKFVPIKIIEADFVQTNILCPHKDNFKDRRLLLWK